MTDEEARIVLMMVLEVAAILEEDVEETAQPEQAEDKKKEYIMVQKPKTSKELRVEIVKLLPDLDLEQLASVSRLVGITEKEIAEDLARAGA